LRAAWPLDRRDGVGIAGFVLLIYGIAQLSAPAAWIAAGLLLLAGWSSVFWAKGKKG